MLDGAWVVGGVSADGVALVELVEHMTIEDARVEEEHKFKLEEALERKDDDEVIEKLKGQRGEWISAMVRPARGTGHPRCRGRHRLSSGSRGGSAPFALRVRVGIWVDRD